MSATLYIWHCPSRWVSNPINSMSVVFSLIHICIRISALHIICKGKILAKKIRTPRDYACLHETFGRAHCFFDTKEKGVLFVGTLRCCCLKKLKSALLCICNFERICNVVSYLRMCLYFKDCATWFACVHVQDICILSKPLFHLCHCICGESVIHGCNGI